MKPNPISALTIGALLIISIGFLAFNQANSATKATYAIVELSSDQNLIICKGEEDCSVKNLPAPNRAYKRSLMSAQALLEEFSKLQDEGFTLVQSSAGDRGQTFVFKK